MKRLVPLLVGVLLAAGCSDGVEPVRVFLRFEVVETSPGAVLQVRDILVR